MPGHEIRGRMGVFADHLRLHLLALVFESVS